MEKLKPCPFCGGDAEVIVKKRDEVEGGAFISDEVACVQCVQCHAQSAWLVHMPLAKKRAMQRWAMRHEPPTPGGAIVPAGNERLKK